MNYRPAYFKIATRYFWPTISKDLRDFIAASPQCQAHTLWPNRPQAPLQLFPPISSPMERISMDVAKFPLTPWNNCCVLMIVDHFSRWAEAWPMPDEKTETIARLYLHNFVCRYGVPKTVITDQGPNFASNLIKALHKFPGTRRYQTTAYHPQSSGLTERTIGSLRSILRKYVSRTQTNWGLWLPWALFCYRVSIHSTLQDTPHYVLFGRDPKLPTDWTLPVFEPDEFPLPYFRPIWEFAKAAIGEAALNTKIIHNKSVRPKGFDVGQLVMRNIAKRPLPPGCTHNTKLRQNMTAISHL